MRPIDWTDYRQAFEQNHFDEEKTIKSLSEKWKLVDVYAAQKQFQDKLDNSNVHAALLRQTSPLSSGMVSDINLLKKNSEGIAAQIKAGTKIR